MAVLLVLMLLTVGMAAESCPIFTCASLESDVCAVEDASGNVQVNSNGCESGMGCFLYLVPPYFTVFPNNTLLCYEVSTEYNYTAYLNTLEEIGLVVTMEEVMEMICNQTVKEGKSFKNGQTGPLFCNDYRDCLLEDGNYTECNCYSRTDGKRVCRREIANHQVFPEMYEFCQKGVFNPSTYEEYIYNLLYYNAIEVLQSELACANKFIDWTYLDSTANTYVSAETSEGRIGSGVALVLDVLLYVTLLP